MDIFAPSNIKDELLCRMMGLKEKSLSVILSESTAGDFSNQLNSERERELEKLFSASFPDSEKPDDSEWRNFFFLADFAMKSWIEPLRQEILQSLPNNKASEAENVDLWFDLWQLKKCKNDVALIMDLDNRRHGDNCTGIRCNVDKLSGGDRQILNLISFDIMNLYDPCVIKRLWMADITSDYPFFDALADTIKNYVQGPAKNNVLAENRFNLVTMVLCELQRLGFVDLVGRANESKNESEWEFARQVIRSFLVNSPTLLSKKYFQKKDFSEKFSIEFDASKMPAKELVKYKYSNSAHRFRLRQWLFLK